MYKSIKDLSKELNCSYEAIRQHTKRYKTELSGHIIRNGKTQMLDGYACEFIKQKRIENPVIVQTIEKDEYTKQLEQENKSLLIAVNELQKELLQLREDKHTLELETVKLGLLEANNNDLKAECETLRAENTNLKNRSFWERIRNK